MYTYTRKVTLDEFENKPRKAVVSLCYLLTTGTCSNALSICKERERGEPKNEDRFQAFFDKLWNLLYLMSLQWVGGW